MSARPVRRVLVTGAASGIGRAIAARFAADGAAVLISDRQSAALSESAAALSLPAFAADVTDEAAITALFEAVKRELGGIDVCVANAGVIRVAPVVETSLAEWRAVMSVNTDGVFLTARAAAHAMIAAGNGGLILTAASGAGKRGVANLAAYCASKAAVIVFTQALALELAPHRIRVNAIAAGHIETPFWREIAAGFAGATGLTPEAIIERFRASVPWGRFGTPEEVAALAAFLAGDEAAYITAQTLAINGGEFPT